MKISVIAMTVVLSVSIAAPAIVSATGQEAAIQTEPKTFQGQLVRLDPENKAIWVKGEGNQEMAFEYNDQTEIVRNDKGAQGLADQAGKMLKVSYSDHAGKMIATRIELLEEKTPQPQPPAVPLPTPLPETQPERPRP